MRLIDVGELEPDTDYDDGEYFAYSKAQIENAPTIELDWTELMVICDNCGHAITVKRTDAKPTIEPERTGKWIPCSERLPEDDLFTLISKRPNLLSGKKWCVTIAGRFKGARNNLVEWRDIGFRKLQDDEILAWMPLPEPYQEEGD